MGWLGLHAACVRKRNSTQAQAFVVERLSQLQKVHLGSLNLPPKCLNACLNNSSFFTHDELVLVIQAWFNQMHQSYCWLAFLLHAMQS